MNGGEKLFWEQYLMCGDYPEYLCGGYRYYLYITETDYHGPNGDHYGIILAYDITSRPSFEEACRLHSTIGNSSSQRLEAVPVLLLGLKADLGEVARQVTREEAEKFAQDHHCRHAECSALTGEGVQKAFGCFVVGAYTSTTQLEGDRVGLQSRRERSRKAFFRAQDALHSRPSEENPGDRLISQDA